MFCSSWPLWSPPPCPGSGRRRRRSRHQSTREKEVRDKRGRWLMWQILVSKPLIPVDFPSRWNCPEEAAAKSQIYAMGRNHWIWGGIEKITCIHREQIYSVYIMYVQYKYSLKIKQKMSDFCVILSKYSHDTLSRHASAVFSSHSDQRYPTGFVLLSKFLPQVETLDKALLCRPTRAHSYWAP